MSAINIQDLTPEQQAALLAQLDPEKLKEAAKQAEARERAAKAKAIRAYEKRKDAVVTDLVEQARRIEEMLGAFKGESFDLIDSLYNEMLLIGGIVRDNHKGNLTLTNGKGTARLRFKITDRYHFNEMAEAAETRLNAFLDRMVKKQDQKNFELIRALLERNSATGKLDPRSVQRLYKYEDQFQDDDWKEALRLFKLAYEVEGSRSYVQFYWKRSEKDQSWRSVVLSLSAVDADYPETEEGDE